MPEPTIGSTLGGCEILEVIGQGGMGIIYKARQKSLDRVVALKVLAPKLANDINFVTRFQREARAIARVNHPNILAVYDVGAEIDFHYMIMELIEGESLAELQARIRGPLKTEDAYQYVRASAQGLEAAQAGGITHRDIKPENLMLTKKGVIKVSDFGLAKESDSASTSTDAVMGTPAFMSPEQCDGKKVDGRTDIYSLGGTFYKLVTGRLPFEAETAMSMMYRHKHEALVPPREIVPAIPEALSNVIVKMMAKKRDLRYQNMGEVLEALDSAMQGSLTMPPARPSGRQAKQSGSDIDIVLPEAPPPDRPGGGMDSAVNDRHTSVLGRRGDLPPPPPPGVSGRMMPLGGSGGIGKASERLGRPGAAAGGAPGGGSSAKMMPQAFAAGTGEDGFTLAARGDDLMARGDRLGGLKLFRQALQTHGLDGASRQRLETEIQNEIRTRRQAGESLLRRGLLVESSREFRLLLELDPKDEAIKASLKEIDHKLSLKRTLINDIRTAIAGLQFEQAIQAWDRTPMDLRDEALGKQIEHLRGVIVPSLKLCEQGELYNEQGRLEEAVSAFQDALRIDENCERARRGLNEAEGKTHRIDVMLKEGYEFSLKQDFQKAIDTWKPILTLRPGHPQGMKSIVDAYVAMAQDCRAQGDLKGAWKAYGGAHEVDPQNRTVARQYEEMTDLHDKEQALIDRANDASARGRGGEAIRYWKEVQRINPANKNVKGMIETLGKQRGLRYAQTLVILLVLGSVGFGGYQFVIERSAKVKALGMIDEKQFNEALRVLRETTFILDLGERKQADIAREAELGDLLYKGEGFKKVGLALEQDGKLRGASDNYKSAIEVYKDFLNKAGPGRHKELLELEIMKLDATSWRLLGEAAIKAKQWEEAKGNFKESRNILRDRSEKELIEIADQSQRAITFIEYLEKALKTMDSNREEAIRLFEQALVLRPNDALVKEAMSNLGLDAGLYAASIQEAVNSLSEPWKPESFAQARAALAKADKARPGQKRQKVLNLYLQDMEYCASLGMVLFNSVNPKEESILWSKTEREDAFCIDRYEFPNRPNVAPQGGQSWLEAKKACEDTPKESKELCTWRQWELACMGKDKMSRFTYGGEDPIANACNWSGGSVQPSGSFTKCFNNIGAYDMNGNLAEWTLDGNGAGSAFLAGGHFQSGTDDRSGSDAANCVKRSWITKPADEKFKAPYSGFRCCKKLKAP